jgi:hypothetical protein
MRSTSLRFLTILLACLLSSMMALGCATMQEKSQARPAATLVITPSSGLPQAKIEILGTGFLPGETIEVIMEVEGVPTDLGGKPMVKKANEQGAFQTASNIPRMATPGVYTVRAEGDKGTLAVAPLAVEEKPKKK